MPKDSPPPQLDSATVTVQLSDEDINTLEQAMYRTQEDNHATFINESMKVYTELIRQVFSGKTIMLWDPDTKSSTTFHSGPLDNAAIVGEIDRREQAAKARQAYPKPTVVVNNPNN